MRRATGRTLRVPTLAERLRWHGEASSSAPTCRPAPPISRTRRARLSSIIRRAAMDRAEPIDDPASAALEKRHRRRPGDDRAVLRRHRRGARAGARGDVAFRTRLYRPPFAARLAAAPRGDRRRRSLRAPGVRDGAAARPGAARTSSSSPAPTTGWRRSRRRSTSPARWSRPGSRRRPIRAMSSSRRRALRRRSIFSQRARGSGAATTADFLGRENWAGRVVAGAELARDRAADRYGAAGRGGDGDRRPGQPARRRAATARSSATPTTAKARSASASTAGSAARAEPVPDRPGRRVRRAHRDTADLADRHRADRPAPSAYGPRRHGRAARCRRADAGRAGQPARGRPRSGFIEVFPIFLRLGLTSFGGPLAHLGYFRSEFVERRRWLDERAFADIVALCQFLPGPASSQTGISIGLLRGGLPGGLAAWLGFTMPSAVAMIAFGYGVSRLGDIAGRGVAARAEDRRGRGRRQRGLGHGAQPVPRPRAGNDGGRRGDPGAGLAALGGADRGDRRRRSDRLVVSRRRRCRGARTRRWRCACRSGRWLRGWRVRRAAGRPAAAVEGGAKPRARRVRRVLSLRRAGVRRRACRAAAVAGGGGAAGLGVERRLPRRVRRGPGGAGAALHLQRLSRHGDETSRPTVGSAGCCASSRSSCRRF